MTDEDTRRQLDALTFTGRGTTADGREIRKVGALADVEAALADCPFKIISPCFVVTLDMLGGPDGELRYPGRDSVDDMYDRMGESLITKRDYE